MDLRHYDIIGSGEKMGVGAFEGYPWGYILPSVLPLPAASW